MNKESVEFDLKAVPNADVVVPKSVLHRLNIRKGTMVHVRLTAMQLTGKLRKRNVTEEEIERISALQLEPRENVVRFLATESVLAGNKRFRGWFTALRSRR